MCLVVAQCHLAVLVSIAAFFPLTHALLQSDQLEILLQIRRHLEFPSQLDVWENHTVDLCGIRSSSVLGVACHNGFVTELQIVGDKSGKGHGFHGYAMSNLTLSRSFSIASFSSTLARLTKLKELCLVSLGIWGRLPENVHWSNDLEVLDLSSNFLYGRIPPSFVRLSKLHSLVLDGNYLNATLPPWLDSMNVLVLSLKNNRFRGGIPESLSTMSSLTNLALSHNLLNGTLPDLSRLINLRTLDLRDNKFCSELPPLPKGIVTALISGNTFRGKIPEEFGTLNRLQHLDLSINHLTGTPPASLFSLPNIRYLDLAFNRLSGKLSRHLLCGSRLGYVDLSNNKLVGDLPHCLNNTLGMRVVKIGTNCFLSSAGNQRLVYCSDADTFANKRRSFLTIGVGVVIVLVGALGLAVGLICFCRRRRCRRKPEHNIYIKTSQEHEPFKISNDYLANARFISETAKLGSQGSNLCRIFQLEELKNATNNFDSQSLIGEGSIGKLYKGKLKNNTFVAIRSLYLTKKQSLQNLKVRLNLLSKLCHPHLVTLLGHCINNEVESSVTRIYLVYEFLPRCNYRSHLAEASHDKALKWSDRLAILTGVARAVHFLHTGVVPGTVNNRLKTNNILFDEHRVGKLSDYGMTILTEEFEKFESKGAEGTKSGYKFNLEDDVYNFGFILLETLVGSVVSGKGEAFLLNEMGSFSSHDGRKRVVDPVVLTTSSQESLSIVVKLTSKCISPDPSSRPSFEDILWNLQYAAQVQATYELDQKPECS